MKTNTLQIDYLMIEHIHLLLQLILINILIITTTIFIFLFFNNIRFIPSLLLLLELQSELPSLLFLLVPNKLYFLQYFVQTKPIIHTLINPVNYLLLKFDQLLIIHPNQLFPNIANIIDSLFSFLVPCSSYNMGP